MDSLQLASATAPAQQIVPDWNRNARSPFMDSESESCWDDDKSRDVKRARRRKGFGHCAWAERTIS